MQVSGQVYAPVTLPQEKNSPYSLTRKLVDVSKKKHIKSLIPAGNRTPCCPAPSLRRIASCVYITLVLDIFDEESKQINYTFFFTYCSVYNWVENVIRLYSGYCTYLEIRCEYF
jgi:hypothetical protein